MARAERDRAENAPLRLPEEGSWSQRLTSTERSVVARVAQGAANREIAAGLVLSVKTVEAALTRAYRRLGATSRVEITRIVVARPIGRGARPVPAGGPVTAFRTDRVRPGVA